MNSDVLMVLTNLPSRESAEKLASELVARRLAACVNMLAPCRSVYRWQDKIQCGDEYPMLIKTTQDRYAALEEAIRAMHPNERPEMIAVQVVEGLPAYLQWVDTETQPLH